MLKNQFALLPLVFTVFMIMNFQAQSQENKVNWQSWDQGYVQGKKTNKPLLIDVYTDWCSWCKKMDRDTYAKTEIIEIIDKYYIAVKFNPEKPGEYDVDGKKVSGRQLLGMLAQNNRVGYPTTFFLYANQRVVQMVQGYQGPEKFKETLETHKEFKEIEPQE
jgi:uncharacterized protein YyaL (SSP411 family)